MNVLQLPESFTVYLYREAVDGRKQINGLSVLVQEAMRHSPFSPALFGFVSRSRRQVKLLYWSSNGFCLWQKRLEKHRFPWPSADASEVVTLTEAELNWLLRGIDFFRLKAHETLSFTSVA